jgi:hypothetical protein
MGKTTAWALLALLLAAPSGPAPAGQADYPHGIGK